MKTKEIWKLLRGYDRAWSNPDCRNLPRLTKAGYLHYREVFQTRMMKALLEDVKQWRISHMPFAMWAKEMAAIGSNCSRFMAGKFPRSERYTDCRELVDDKGRCWEMDCKYKIKKGEREHGEGD